MPGTAPARPGPLKNRQEQGVMEGSTERRKRTGRQHPSSKRTLELLRQELEDTVFLDNLEDGGVSLLLDRRQLHYHPRADHARPCNQGHQVKSRQGASAELDKNRGII
jgi:hypothetical protein